MKVMCIKISKNKLRNPKQIIWDKVYLVEDEEVIPRLTDCSLVIPFNESVYNMLQNTLFPKGIRNDVPCVEHEFYRSKKETEITLNYDILKYKFMVILILTKKSKKEKNSNLSYLTSANYNPKTSSNRFSSYSNFPEGSYLQTPNGKIDPICLGCRRSMDGMLGKCNLGQYQCYQELVVNGINSFQQMMEAGNKVNEESIQITEAKFDEEEVSCEFI